MTRSRRTPSREPPAPTLADLAKIVELRTKIVSLSSLGIGTLWAAAAAHFRG